MSVTLSAGLHPSGVGNARNTTIQYYHDIRDMASIVIPNISHYTAKFSVTIDANTINLDQHVLAVEQNVSVN